jgi:hypothetical protein
MCLADGIVCLRGRTDRGQNERDDDDRNCSQDEGSPGDVRDECRMLVERSTRVQ